MFLPKLIGKYKMLVLVFAFMQFAQHQEALAQFQVDGKIRDIALMAEDFMAQSKYDSAIFYFRVLADQAARDSNWQTQIQFHLRLIEAYRSLDLFNETDSCLAIIESNTNYDINLFPLEKAEFLHQKGTLKGKRRNYLEAIDYLNQSVKIRIEKNGTADSVLAKSYNNLGAYYYFLGELDKSIDFYGKAIKIVNESKYQKKELASYIQNLGIVYAGMGDFEKALNYFNNTLTINEEILKPDDPAIADICLNLGRLYSLLSRFDEALENNDKAEQIYIKKFGIDYSSLGSIYLNKSAIYIKLSEYEDAVKYLNNALNIYNLNPSANEPNIARIYNNLGLVYLTKKDYLLASDYFQKSLDIQKDASSRSILLRNIASVYDKLGEKAEADRFFKQSLAFSLKELGENHYEYGNALKSYGGFLVNNGKLKEAESYIQKALNNHNVNYAERNVNLSEIYLLYGRYFYTAKKYKEALEYYQKAMISNDFVFSDLNIFQNASTDNAISKSSMLDILLAKAKAFSYLYSSEKSDTTYLDAALKCYREAMPVFEQLRSQLKYESKLILMENTIGHFDIAYEDFFENYLKHQDAEALKSTFEFIEKNKAAVLLSSMKDMDAIKFGGIPVEYQKLERELNERINGYENLIYNQKQVRKPDSSKIVLWEKRLFEISNRYDSLIKVFGEQYPAYYDLKYDHSVININEVQVNLDEDQAIVEYTLTDSTLYTFLITPISSAFYKTDLDSTFFRKLAILQQVSKIDYADHSLSDFSRYVMASNDIYRTLFSKVEGDMKDKRIIIVPDGKLGYLSFESLVTTLPDMKNIDYRNLDYLIKRNPISYSYSSTLLFKNNVSKTNGNSVLAFAPAYDSGIRSNENESTLRQITNQLRPLVNAQEEVVNVMSLFRGTVFNNDEATEFNFKLNSPKYDVLHLAMHTLMNDEDPMYSKMVFTMDNDSIEDGYLNTFEIYNLNLNAQLAVLSACNTGSGKILNGEGIMSLARGFIYSGVPSIVMTLWEVDDKSGADIMTAFYSHLKDGLSKDVALQKAKLDYLSTASQLRAYPYFWSAYVNIGNSKPLQESNTFNYLLVLGLLVISGLVLFFLKRKKLP
ncbi:MAG: hypothetical protein CVU00_14760 [Bacteroidetes bacterium HGW-Bacteroidetes-17]|jgi:CHAT domain-containing protein/tetratricopeptide (TPR) repeat protein|nr:MAG: hypothetical protein CVU00_14760 [Bacteroidetes bacterium HGW-Bacteroidetes-17]